MTELERQQRNVLHRLLDKARGTHVHNDLLLGQASSYEEFDQLCPVLDWQFYQTYVDLAKKGIHDVMSLGLIDRFAVSSGTTGNGKHIPVPSSRLKTDRGFMQSVASLLINQLGGRFFQLLGGVHISLPGSLDLIENDNHQYKIGEITAHLADVAPFWSTYQQLIPPSKLIQWDVQTKLNRIIEKSVQADIRLITAAPCWIPQLFEGVLDKTGASSISECWPKLTAIIAGGMNVSPYLNELRRYWGDPDTFPTVIETYGASEGYFGFTAQTGDDPIHLVINQNVFFEGIPEDSKVPIPCWKFHPGEVYDLVISSDSGLWRYRLGDRIRWSDSSQPSLYVVGRNDVQFDRYGEAVSVNEIESIIREYIPSLINFTQISGSYYPNNPPSHQWWIIYEQSCPKVRLQAVSDILDQKLQELNRHYALRRNSGVLGIPKIKISSSKDMLDYLNEAGKLKSQMGIPLIL